MKTTTARTTSIHKVRRDSIGGKRGDGDKRTSRIRRSDATRIHIGAPDPTLTGVAGLAGFGAFVRREGVDAELKRRFFRLKSSALVVYPMEAQLRLLIDANIAGETRVFGLEALAADPLFVRLAGGVVPSIDTVYRDLCRFDDEAVRDLESLVADQGLMGVRRRREATHLDIDTTVEPVFGSQEGALPGPNPRYHGRPSYHPIVAFIAELGTCAGALLRPGNRGLGDDDASIVRRWVWRARQALHPRAILTVRMDAGADCSKILRAVHDCRARFIVKAKLSPDLCRTITLTKRWTTVDWDADGRPSRQVAEIEFQREGWPRGDRRFRVIAVRSRDRDVGKQIFLWNELEYTVQAFITNDPIADADNVAREYDGRAEIEPQIGECKHGWDIDKVPSRDFRANHTMLLIKLLAHNLMRRFVSWIAPRFSAWRITWIRRVLIAVAGRLIHSGRQWCLRLPPHSPLLRLRSLLE
jgi:hypothetical protein